MAPPGGGRQHHYHQRESRRGGEWWKGTSDRPERRSYGGGGSHHRGGGYRGGRPHYSSPHRRHTGDFSGGGGGGPGPASKRRRVDHQNTLNQAPRPPAQPTGAAGVRLVQLFVRVADVVARATTDAGSSLSDNIAQLAAAVAAKDLTDDADRVARLLLLVCRSSPLGARPLATLGAELELANISDASSSSLSFSLVSAKAAADALKHPFGRVDAKLALKFRCELGYVGQRRRQKSGSVGAAATLPWPLDRLAAFATSEPRPRSDEARDPCVWRARRELAAELLVSCCAAALPHITTTNDAATTTLETIESCVAALRTYVGSARRKAARFRLVGNAADSDDDPVDALEYGVRALADAVDRKNVPRLAPLTVSSSAAGTDEDTSRGEDDDDSETLKQLAALDDAALDALLTSPCFASGYEGAFPLLPGALPALKGTSDDSEKAAEPSPAPLSMTPLERYLVLDAAADALSSFRVGARWDGIVVGDRNGAAKQLAACRQILEIKSDDSEEEEEDALDVECLDLVASALLGLLVANRPHADGGRGSEKAPKPDATLDAVHAALELCREAPKFAARLAVKVELAFRDLDALDVRAAERLALFLAHFLNNTKFAWPYWGYWADLLDDLSRWDAQRRFLTDLLDRCVRLSYVDRVKCADGFPVALHKLLPEQQQKTDDDDDDDHHGSEEARSFLPDALAEALEAILDEEEEDEDDEDEDKDAEAMKETKIPPSAPSGEEETKGGPARKWLASLGSDAATCGAVVRSALGSPAAKRTVSHALAALDAVATPLAGLASGDATCEKSCLDAVFAIWRGAPSFHAEFLCDALVRRGVVRPRALVANLVRNSSSAGRVESIAEVGIASLATSASPGRLVDVAVDRALDLVAAAMAAAETKPPKAITDGASGEPDAADDEEENENPVLAAQLDEAKAVFADLVSGVADALDAAAKRRRQDMDTDAATSEMKDDDDDDLEERDAACAAAALGLLKDVAARYDRARVAGALELDRRSSVAFFGRPLPRALDPAAVADAALAAIPDLDADVATRIRTCFQP